MTLDLSHNGITAIDERDFKDLNSLRLLQLNNRNIVNVNYIAFRTNLNLVTVDLSHNNLKCLPKFNEQHRHQVVDKEEKHLIRTDESNNWIITIFIVVIIMVSSVFFICCVSQC